MPNRRIGFVAVSLDDAVLFFERCIYKEAITPEERLAVLEEMAEEKRILLAGTLDDKTSEAVDEFMSKTKHKGVIGIKANEPDA